MRIYLVGIYWWFSLFYIFIVDKYIYFMGGNFDIKFLGMINLKIYWDLLFKMEIIYKVIGFDLFCGFFINNLIN